jgi:hypothetical protein
VRNISEDGMTTEPTDFFLTGRPGTKHKVDMNVRDTVSLLDRNVEMSAGYNRTFDEILWPLLRPARTWCYHYGTLSHNGCAVHKSDKCVIPGKQRVYTCRPYSYFHLYTAL